jgi:FAD/FMN-containing dehydrogenase/Fe-S oxidoreductase
VDERRARVHDDLRGVLGGELLFEPVERAPYAYDAGLHEIDPLGIVAPKGLDDLIALVRYAAEHEIPMHPRGAGTGTAGGCLGPGLVVDFSRHFRRVLEVRPESVVVQAGVVLDVLNAELAPLGRRIGPDPEGSEACTVGGMIGADSVGSRALRVGATSDHVECLRVVFANGEVADLGRGPRPSLEEEPRDFKGSVAQRIVRLANWNADLLARSCSCRRRDRAGYALGAAVADGQLDLARLVVGSEGTLALVAEATLRTVPIPSAQAAVLLLFGRLVDAAEAVPACLEEDPSSCDLHDWRTLSLLREADPTSRDWIPEAAESALVVEFDGDDPGAVARRARALAGRLARVGRLVADPVEALRRAEIDRLSGLRRAVTRLLMRTKGPSRPVPLLGDLAVPIPALAPFLAQLQAILKSHGVTATIGGQVGLGRIHAQPFLDLADPGDLEKLGPLASDVYAAVRDAGGTLGRGQGCGLTRTSALRRLNGEMAGIVREIKHAFDPEGLLNPGKVVGEESTPIARALRGPAAPVGAEGMPSGDGLPVIARPLLWPDRARAEHVSACNGCGACRTREPSLRMCPTFRALRAEAATPRAKANLLRQVAAGRLDPKTWGSEPFRDNADLCVHCHLCSSECPAGVDVSALMLEAKAAHVEAHGLAPDDWMLSRIDRWSAWAGRVPALFNAVMNIPPARWALERLFGLSRYRILPRARRTPFLRRAERLGLTHPRPQGSGPRVAYFVDIFANYFDPELAEDVLAVLQHAGVNVFVPKGQRGCGMPALVAGDLDRARTLLAANLRVLGNAVRDGYTVVCSEPTAALMLRKEALRLTDDLDATLVAANTLDVGEYLAGLEVRGQLPKPAQPVSARVGYHQPCHLRALGAGTPGLDLIRSIPELEVEFIDRGCSGIAGTFGLSRRNFRTSLRAGRGLRNRLRDGDIDLGATECGACRMQMEQGIPKRTLHPVKLLSLSYGLNPSLRLGLKGAKSRHEIA